MEHQVCLCVTCLIFFKVTDFGASWRDGNAFIAVVNSIRPGKIDRWIDI